MVDLDVIHISRNRKITRDYKSYGYDVGVSANLEMMEDVGEATEKIYKILDALEKYERKRIEGELNG